MDIKVTTKMRTTPHIAQHTTMIVISLSSNLALFVDGDGSCTAIWKQNVSLDECFSVWLGTAILTGGCEISFCIEQELT